MWNVTRRYSPGSVCMPKKKLLSKIQLLFVIFTFYLNVPIAVDRIRRGNWIQITRKARRVGDVPLRWGLDGVLVVDRGVFISLLPFVFLLPKKTQLDRKRLRIQESETQNKTRKRMGLGTQSTSKMYTLSTF